MSELSYLKVFLDWTEATEKLSDADKGRLIDAMVMYARGDKDAESRLKGNEAYLFPMFRLQIDRDKQEISKKRQTNSENGQKGGAPKGNQNARKHNPEQPKTTENNRNKPDKDKDYGLMTTDDDTPPTPPAGGTGEAPPWAETPAPQGDADAGSAADAEFDRFWEAYPRIRRQAKGEARKAFAKARKKAPLDVMLAAIERQKTSWDWTKEGGQFIPRPASWLNKERWNDDWDSGSPQNANPSPPGQRRRKTVAEVRAEMEARNAQGHGGDWT